MKKIIILIISALLSNYCMADKAVSTDLLPIHIAALDSMPTYGDIKFKQLMDAAHDGNKESMYYIGIAYLTGAYVNKNFDKAYEWTSKSADLGFIPAIIELGQYHQYGTGRPVDCLKAYTFYSKAAALNNIDGLYLKGYMEYKGLGCSQNYNAAVFDFKKGVALNSSRAMYMLGICFRNGFGITMNTDSARYWLKRALDLKFTSAFDELQTPTAEYNPTNSTMVQNISAAKIISNTDLLTIDSFSNIQNNNLKNIESGTYEGYWIKYDYSGKKITEVSGTKFLLSVKDSLVTGMLKENGRKDTLVFSGIKHGNKLSFKDTYYRRSDHYHELRPIYQFKEAYFENSSAKFIRVNLNIEYPAIDESYYPVTLILKKLSSDAPKISMTNNNHNSDISLETLTDESDEKGKKILSFNAFPNPFDNEINIGFSLLKPTDAHLELVTMDGKILFKKKFNDLEVGEHFFNIPIVVASGEYLIQLKTEEETEVFKIIKQ